MTSGIEQGQRFRFRLGDVICPDRHEAISQITPELEVNGKVVFLSDQGEQAERFAVLEVSGLYSPLIVPLERLEPTVEQGETDQRTMPREAMSRRE
jgi:hypothetical protein